jgi:hypothetical protein
MIREHLKHWKLIPASIALLYLVFGASIVIENYINRARGSSAYVHVEV